MSQHNSNFMMSTLRGRPRASTFLYGKRGLQLINLSSFSSNCLFYVNNIRMYTSKMELQNICLEDILGNKLYLPQKYDADICICHMNKLIHMNNNQLKKKLTMNVMYAKFSFLGAYLKFELYIKISFSLTSISSYNVIFQLFVGTRRKPSSFCQDLFLLCSVQSHSEPTTNVIIKINFIIKELLYFVGQSPF